MAVTRFEDLRAWQRAMDLAEKVQGVLRNSALGRDRVFADQVWRCAISVPSNIAEGFERYSRVDFGRFLGIAKGSCGELRSQLHLAARTRMVDAKIAEMMIADSEVVSKVIGSLRASLARKKDS